MKKNILTLLAGTFFLIPLYGYADEIPLKLATAATTTVLEEVVMGTTTASTTPVRTFTICSQEAIEARDTRIAASRSTYNTAMANALTERKNREKAAVAIRDEDDRKDAIKASVDTYKHQAKAAQTTLTQARKLAWQTFDNDIKACRDLEQITNESASSMKAEEDQTPTTRTMKKGEDVEVKDQKISEVKSFKNTLKDKFESIKSLFN